MYSSETRFNFVTMACKLPQLILSTLLVFICWTTYAATVDSLELPSAAMNKTYKAAVVLPASYATGKAIYPVLYLLHGGLGHFRDWQTSTPDKMLIPKLADQYNLIVVMPEGKSFGWYLDSPVNPASKFETYIIHEVISKIDSTYRTVRSKKGRVITGLSMGGHGALYLSARHPALFCAAGSMSGGLDMNWLNYRVDEKFAKFLQESFTKLMGTADPYDELYVKNSVVNMTDRMKKNGLALIIDYGVDDHTIETNRELHRRLLYNRTPHDYTERPGAHTWAYWQNSLPNHVAFFYQILKTNAVTVP